MSLEVALKENTEVMRQLIAAMHNTGTFTAPEPEKKDVNKGRKSSSNEAANTECEQKLPDIESLDIRLIPVLANMFGDEARSPTPEQIEKARAYANSTKSDKYTDALNFALKDCKAVKPAPRAVVFDLCLVMLAHWSAMENVDERRAFAELYIKTPYNKRADLIPRKAEPEPDPESEQAPEPEAVPEDNHERGQDTAATFEQARALIMKLTTGGYRNEALEILDKFGAQKLGQVPRENLAEVAKLAEQALAGE